MPMQTQNKPQPIPRRASNRQTQITRTTQAVPPTVDEISEDERLYQPMHHGTSTRRYRTTEGTPVVVQGNRRYVLHTEPPPHLLQLAPGRASRPVRGVHWLVPFGLGMLVMVLLVLGTNWVDTTWHAWQLNTTYGMPRTFQTDSVVGHNGDSPAHPSHFTFQNVQGKITIIEFPAGDATKAIVYTGPPIIGENAESVPVTGSFADMNGDGKPDMVVQVMNQRFVYLNTGTKFVSSGQ